MNRVGIGHDTHRLAPNGPLILGGISIDAPFHAVGHSDADVLLHAITDALLGAAGLGDIGELFPDTDSRNKNRNSVEMLQLAWQQVQAAGWQIVNLDCIVFAQRPKLSGHKNAINESIANALNISQTQVNIKAKTGEGVDSVGREEAIMAQAIVLLSKE